jgi:hypothetical protein
MLREGWVARDDLPDYEGAPYTTHQRPVMVRNWLPSPAQRLYLDAFDQLLEKRDDRSSNRAGGYRHVLYFEREVPALARKANDFDGMIAKIAPVICTPKQLELLRRPQSYSR